MDQCPVCGYRETADLSGKAFKNKFSTYVDAKTGNVVGTMMDDKEEVVIEKEDAAGTKFTRTLIRQDVYAAKQAAKSTAPTGKVAEVVAKPTETTPKK